MATSLVTGGAGFIGAHLIRALLCRGDHVVVLDDLSGGFAENVPGDARFVEGSITDASAVERAFAGERVDYVYHLAAYAAEGLSHFIRAYNYTNNVVGSMHVINACVRHEVRCLVFTSSIAVYGASQLPMSESHAPRPEDPYGVAKYAVELDLRAAHGMFGLEFVIFRPHNVYGEYQNIGDRYRNVIGIFMNRLMQGESMPIFGDGSQTRAFSYVGDIVPALAAAVHTPGAVGEVFNVGASQEHSVSDLATAVAAALGTDRRVIHLPARHEVRHAYGDHAKVRRVFGAQPETPLADGLRRMADWARVVGPRRARAFHDIELSHNLPPSWRD
jgi:UDP-glucose 4-epimerase